MERIPEKAGKILEDCTTEDSHLLSEQGLGDGDESLDGLDGREGGPGSGASRASAGGGGSQPITTLRLKPHPDELHATHALFGGNSGTCRCLSLSLIITPFPSLLCPPSLIIHNNNFLPHHSFLIPTPTPFSNMIP